MQPVRLTPAAALAAASAGAAAWCSLGSVALSDAGLRAVRVAVLPPLWWLAALIAGAIALVWVFRLSSDRAKPLFFSVLLFLPWLPVTLPAALLLWAGPFVWLVWAAIAAAVVTAGGAPAAGFSRVRASLASPARAPWLAFLCAALIYNAAAWRLAPQVPGGDEPHYLIIAQSLWRDGDLRIENNHERGDYLEYFGGALRPDYLKRGADGEIYSIHLPGVAAIIAPLLALGGYGLVKVFLALASAAATGVAWRAAYVVTGHTAAAWFGWAAAALAAPVLLLSFTVYPDGLGAIVVMAAFAMVAVLQDRASRPGWWWALAGLLPALLPWFHPRFSVLAASLGLVLAGRALRDSRPARALASLLAIPAASAMGWFGYYYTIYGRFNPSVAYGHYTQMSAGRVPTGILGLLFDQQYGLIVYAPVAAIGAVGLAALARRRPRLALEWTAIVVPYAVVTAMYHMWWGGFSSPARFIGATLLLFAVPAASAWASATHAVTRTVQAAALGVSAGISVMLVAVDRGAFAFNVRGVEAPWLAWASQMADLAHAVPSLFRHGPLTALAEAAVWMAAVVGAWLAARAAARAGALEAGSAALVALCAVGIAVTAAAEATWRIEGVSGTRITSGQLRALETAGAWRGSRAAVLGSRAAIGGGPSLERLRVGAAAAASRSADVWMALPFLPAGRYRMWADLAAAAGLDVQIVAGRSEGPFNSWSIASDGAGAVSRELVLPAAVSGVRVHLRGDAGARAAVRNIWFQPVADGRFAPVTARRAAAAMRYGSLVVYALASAYLEPGGLWTAGGRTAELVVQAEPGDRVAALTMRAGPLVTRVRVSAGAFSLDAELAPGEERELAIPMPPAGSVIVAVQAGPGFRPADTDPSSADRRLLGVRLEPR
ncbi:MAG: hypothetical protein R6V57_13925 [Vicinamibacterales bacterium]